MREQLQKMKRNGYRFRPAFAGLLLLMAGFISAGCGNSEETGNPTVSTLTAPRPKAPVYTTDSLPALYLDREDFLAIDDTVTKYKDKMVLEFRKPSRPADFSFAVFTISDGDKFRKNVSEVANKTMIRYPKPFANELGVAGKKLRLINQRTREAEYGKLLADVKKYSIVRYVIFEPEIEDDHVRFKITGVEKLPYDLMAHGFATKSYYSRSF